MSIDTPDPQSRDLYKYNGERTQPAAKPDRYAYSGDGAKGQAQSAHCHGDRPADHDDTDAICKWRPDTSFSSPAAKEWLKANRASRHQPLPLNADGTYTVQHADCLETIAERELEAEHKSISHKAIDRKVKEIIKFNERDHATLKCNPDFIKDGWTLKLSPAQPEEPARDRQPAVPPGSAGADNYQYSGDGTRKETCAPGTDNYQYSGEPQTRIPACSPGAENPHYVPKYARAQESCAPTDGYTGSVPDAHRADHGSSIPANILRAIISGFYPPHRYDRSYCNDYQPYQPYCQPQSPLSLLFNPGYQYPTYQQWRSSSGPHYRHHGS